MYNSKGQLVCKAGNYPKNIYIDNFGVRPRKMNAGLTNPMYFGLNHRRKRG